MGAINYVLAILAIGAALFIAEASREQRMQDEASHHRQAAAMIVYARAAARYAQANPGQAGPVSNGQLVLPQWLIAPAGISCYVAAGRGYAYAALPSEAESFAVVEAMGSEATAGVIKGGVAISSGGNRLALRWPVPADIPERTAVVFF